METDNVIQIDSWKQQVSNIRAVNSLRKSAVLLLDAGYSLGESKDAMRLAYGDKYFELINEVILNIIRE